MKKTYIIPEEILSEIEPDNLLSVSVPLDDEESDYDDSEKVKEQRRWGIDW